MGIGLSTSLSMAPRRGIVGALSMLGGYSNGIAVDFYSDTVAIKDTTTPASNRSNVPVSSVFSAGPASSWLLATSAFPWDATKGTIYCEAVTTSPNSAQRVYCQIDDGTNNERFLCTLSTVGGGWFLVVDGGSTTISVTPGTAVVGILQRYMATWNSATPRAQASLDGVLGTEDVSFTLPTVNTLRLGAGLSGATPFGGSLGRWLYVPQ